MGKPLLKIQLGGKPGEDDSEDDTDQDTLGEEAAQDLIDAIKSGDAAAVWSAWKAMPCPDSVMEE